VRGPSGAECGCNGWSGKWEWCGGSGGECGAVVCRELAAEALCRRGEEERGERGGYASRALEHHCGGTGWGVCTRWCGGEGTEQRAQREAESRAGYCADACVGTRTGDGIRTDTYRDAGREVVVTEALPWTFAETGALWWVWRRKR
jgi:hypothetical protein